MSENKVTLKKAHAISTIRSGHQALSEIEGLRTLMLRGMLFNYLIFIGATLLLNGLFYYQLLNPFIIWAFGEDGGFWATIGSVVLWSVQITVAAVFAMVALRFSLELASLWHQSLVRKIILHFREIKEPEFSIKDWINEMKTVFREALKACVYPLLILFLGLIPIIGLPIVYILETHLMGKESIIVYLDSISNPNEAIELKKSWKWLSFRLGWLPTSLAFIPFVGWFFLPLILIYQVMGFTYLVEQSRQNSPQPGGSTNTAGISV